LNYTRGASRRGPGSAKTAGAGSQVELVPTSYRNR